MADPTTDIIEDSLKSAMDYDDYVKLMEDLVKDGKSSAPEENEDLAEFSKLNLSRMARWDKKLDFPEDEFPSVAAYQKPITWLIITESWCGDAAHSVPVIAKLAKLNQNIEVKVALRDQNKALIDEFLTNGGRSIPKLIMYDREEKKVKATWGPRPEDATKIFEAYKEDPDNFDEDLNTLLQKWYNKDKGEQSSVEIASKIASV